MSVYSHWVLLWLFLALLVFTRQCRTVVRPSVGPLTRVVRNRFADPGQLLWEATYPPYIQIFFQHFKFHIFMIFCFILLSIGPMRAKLSKHYSSNKLFATGFFFQNYPDFFSEMSSQSYFLRVLKCSYFEF